MEEIWNPVIGYDGYEVSNLGRIKSLNRVIVKSNGRNHSISERFLRFDKKINSAGYYNVCFGRRGYKDVHRAVAESFLGPPPSSRHQVNHKNSNRLDNRVENLEWVTPKDNIAHAIKSGGFNNWYKELSKRSGGTKNPKCKLSEEQVIKIRQLYASGLYQHQIGELFGVCQSTISSITLSETWKKVS